MKWGALRPAASLWTHYFLKGDHDSAVLLWNESKLTVANVNFRAFVVEAKRAESVDLLKKLIEFLKTKDTPPSKIGYLYTVTVQNLTMRAQLDEALDLLKAAVDEVKIENIGRRTLVALKNKAEEAGKIFPYEIPAEEPEATKEASTPENPQ